MKPNKIKVTYILCICGMAIFWQCRKNEFHVRSTNVSTSPQKKVLLGSIQNRDFRTPRAVPKDFHDLLAFELMQKGFSFSPLNFRQLDKEPKLQGQESLPASLNRAAGENGNQLPPIERHLEREEIQSLASREGFDVFIQGTISIQSNDKILERKDYNYIFLNLYNGEGNMVGMISSTFDNQQLYESELMKKVAREVAIEFEKTVTRK